MASFRFCDGTGDCAALNLSHGAYVNGNNKNPCDTGNGGTACLAGKFTIISGKGSVSEAPSAGGTPASVGVQLIR
jgi:hypothetical protein